MTELPRVHQFVVNYEDPYVYRFFDQESHADDFLRGDILVTTLNKCRDHEDPTRRDAGEATETYRTGVVRGHTTSNPAIGRIAEHLGVVRRDYPTRVDLTGNVLERTAPDAHLLCASDRFGRDEMVEFGRFCVQISRPKKFFERLSLQMGEIGPLVFGMMARV